MKGTFTGVLLFYCITVIAQKNPVTRVLNKALLEEQKRQKQNPANYCGGIYEIIKGYHILNDSLQIQLKQALIYEEGYEMATYTVALKDVRAIAKDINILLETHKDAVKMVSHVFYKNGTDTVTTNYSSLYFLHLCDEKNNENFADELVRAFKKLGITIIKSHWYD